MHQVYRKTQPNFLIELCKIFEKLSIWKCHKYVVFPVLSFPVCSNIFYNHQADILKTKFSEEKKKIAEKADIKIVVNKMKFIVAKYD